MPDKLTNLRVEDFAHPDDVAAIKTLTKVKAFDKAMSYIEDKSNQLYIRMNTLGNCVRITEENDPRIFRILKDVCDILDYDTVPELYCTRSYKVDIEPSGVDKPVLLVPDFVLNNYDDSLLYFNFGRAVTRLKSGYLKFYIAARMLITITSPIAFVSDAVKLALANWMRKSELTADRGGLLACQSIRTAMTFLMNKAGMPVQEAKKVNIPDYIAACKTDLGLVKVGKGLQTLTNCTGWANDRIAELFLWHAQGHYDDLLEKYLDY